MRKIVTYGRPLETEIGFSRAKRIGNIIAVSGTAPIAADGSVHAPGDLYAQTVHCLAIAKDVLEKAGGSLDDVIRTRIFLTDMTRWKEAAKAHGELFSEIKPATAFIGSSGFINPEWLVELEMDAVLE